MGAISRKKALGVLCPLEALHVLLTPSRRLVRVLGSMVEPLMLTEHHNWQDLAFGGAIPLQFIGDDHSRHIG